MSKLLVQQGDEEEHGETSPCLPYLLVGRLGSRALPRDGELQINGCYDGEKELGLRVENST